MEGKVGLGLKTTSLTGPSLTKLLTALLPGNPELS